MQKKLFDISGMTCTACATRIENTLAKLSSVKNINVNLLKNRMSIEYDEKVIDVEAIIQSIENIGYQARIHKDRTEQVNHQNQLTLVALELQQMKWRLFISLLFTLPLFYLSMGNMFGLPIPDIFLGERNIFIYAFSQFILVLPVIIVNNKYYRTGFKTLLAGAPNMDSLVAIGSGTALLSGIYTIYKISYAISQNNFAMASHFSMDLYFESAAMILTLITLGKLFEAQAKGKTSEAIEYLVNLVPKTATVIRSGKESIVDTSTLTIDDIVVVRAGETIPIDGIIIQGRAFIDESTITGESLPIEKQNGSHVIGATISTSGYFLMRVTHIGENTTLSQIIKLVDEATSSKAPIARIADKISRIFVPAIIAIAIIATVTWLLLGYSFDFSLSIGIAVLVISCPCALGLATPTAIMVGMGKGAKYGILIKSAEAIEIAQAIDTVILDKTGTITEGKPVVTDLIVLEEKTVNESDHILQIAASLENHSEHPLGKAIINYAAQHTISLINVHDFIQIEGQGISGLVANKRYYAGNKKLLDAQSILIPQEILHHSELLANQGKTVLYITDDQYLLGLITIADAIKKTSRQVVDELHDMGINVIMLTGDNAKTALAIQQQIGIKHIISDVLPQDKEYQVRNLQEQGRKIAMVGDGVNDAPALARADVGIAIGAGTDIAIESADIVLMKNDLLDVITTIQLSKSVMRNIRQNLFWAFFYNIIGIPIAAGVFYHSFGLTLNPMFAAAAMSLSSVCVVLNALRLRLFKPIHCVKKTNNELTHQAKVDLVLNEAVTTENRSIFMKKHILIEGMSCAHCSGRVENVLRAMPGIISAKVDLATNIATIEMDNDISNEALTSAITNIGYEVKRITPL